MLRSLRPRPSRSNALLESAIAGVLGLGVATLATGGSTTAEGQEHTHDEADSVSPGQSSPGHGVPTDVLVPPRLLDAPDPIYPEGLGDDDDGEHTVTLHLTIEADGSVSDAHPEGEHDADFDEAAVETVHRWRFEPARRGETPVRSRVRVAVRFLRPAPSFDLTATPSTGVSHGIEAARGAASSGASSSTTSGSTSSGASSGETDHTDHGDAEHGDGAPDESAANAHGDEERLLAFGARAEVDPLAESRAPRSASSFTLDRALLSAAPHRDVADMLNVAPGLLVMRPEGDGVAPQISLRGFDAEHGQDIELRAGGIPLNQPSHIHGQGYVDLGFLIPEVISSIRVEEGVYDPRQGDFATAGTIDMTLGVRDRGLRAEAQYGSFDTVRALAIFAPSGEREGTFGAFSYRRTQGFGQNRAGQAGTAMAQGVFGDARVRVRLLGAVSVGRYGLAGVLRRDDVLAGRVGYYDTYDFPTATQQSASSMRGIVAGFVELLGQHGSFAELGTYAGFADFRFQGNFTGFREISSINPDWRGRGDLIEQTQQTFTAGLRARYRTERFAAFDLLRGFLEVGLEGRLDVIGQAQNLIQAPQNQTWDQRVDADVRGLDVGAYADLDLHVGDHVVVRGGVRADVLQYDIDDRLGNFIPRYRRDQYILGYRRSALGLAAGPRATLEWTPIEALTLSTSYGEGYRSPQARQLADGETAPYAKVQSADVGARLHLGEHDELRAQVAAFYTHLGYDVAFDPGEGRLESIGPTTRMGVSGQLVVKPWRFLLASISATFVHATLDAPPLASAEDPSPPYQRGQSLPYVPPFVLRGDARAEETLFVIDGHDLEGHVGVGLSVVSSRPLPYGEHATPFGLLDAGVGVAYRGFTLDLTGQNLLDARYAATEYAFASNWSPDRIDSRLPARHFSAGAPLSLSLALGGTF